MISFLEKIIRYISSDKKYLCGYVLGLQWMLTLIGLVVLASASLSFYKTESFFHRQLLWVILSIPFFALGALFDVCSIRKHSTKLLILSAISLLLVLIPGIGKLVNGSRRWLSFGAINFQISEIAKFVVVVWLADYLDRHRTEGDMFLNGFLKPLGIVSFISAMILLEPDYGTAILVGGVTFSLLFLSGTRVTYLLGSMFVAFIGVSILIFFNPVRMHRITSFLDVESNKLGGAYQLWQGILGFVSGGLSGRGLGNGRQQLVYLPEAHTDFILPIFGEECGGIAVICVLLLYFMLFIMCMVTALKLNDKYLSMMSCGIILTITYQVIINVGVVTGMLPTKGMVLPFISYGGSNLLAMFFMVGVLLNCFVSDQIEDL